MLPWNRGFFCCMLGHSPSFSMDFILSRFLYATNSDRTTRENTSKAHTTINSFQYVLVFSGDHVSPGRIIASPWGYQLRSRTSSQGGDFVIHFDTIIGQKLSVAAFFWPTLVDLLPLQLGYNHQPAVRTRIDESLGGVTVLPSPLSQVRSQLAWKNRKCVGWYLYHMAWWNTCGLDGLISY